MSNMRRFRLIEYLLQLDAELRQKPLTDATQPRRRSVTETLTVEDLVAISRSLSLLDSITLSDLINLFSLVGVSVTDVASLSDLVRLATGIKPTDAVTVAETLLQTLLAKLHEVVTVSDALHHRGWSGNLEGFYPLTDGSQPSGVDLSGKNRNATIYGSPNAATIDGKPCLYFDGVNDYADAGSAYRSIIHQSADFSITFWIYLTASKTARKVLQILDTASIRHAVGIDANFRVFYSTYNGSDWSVWRSQDAIQTNRWHHVAVVKRQGQSPVFYINGMPSSQSTNYAATPHYAYPYASLRIGQYSYYYNDWMEGYLADVRIFSNAIDSEMVTQLMLESLTVGDIVRLALRQLTLDGITVGDLVRFGVSQKVADGITVGDIVTLTAQTVGSGGGGIITPSQVYVYNQNYQLISADTTALYDNDISTTFYIYYSPPAPSNPRRVSLVYNQTFGMNTHRIRVYIANKTGGKTLYIDTTLAGEWMESFGVTTTGQWIDLYPVEYFNGLVIYPDTSVLGFIGIAEVQVVPN